MKLKDIYKLAIELALKADPRPKAEIDAILKKREKDYERLDEAEKKYYDTELIRHPYDDSRILHAKNMDDEVKTILAGVDMEGAELLLASHLSKLGQKINLVLSHHPKGRGLLGLGDVMSLQNSIMEECGVPINVAEKILKPRSNEVSRSVHHSNFIRHIHIAQLLGLNYACFHTVTDNLVYRFLKSYISKKKFRTVQDVIEHLLKLPEYEMSAKAGNSPVAVVGSKDSLAGKIFATEMTGGTSGNEAIYEKLSQAGVGTVISMHMDEKHRAEAEKHHLNVIVAGHMASDSLGMNLLFDHFEKRKIKIIPCGMFRVKRTGKN